MANSVRIDAAVGSMAQRTMRVSLYSHDTMGLGHLRRNLLIAEALAAPATNASSLLVTGAHEANFFRLPQRADLLTLPRWRKDSVGDYRSAQLMLERDDLRRLRTDSIRSALEAFRPHLLIVDKVPTGAFGELLPTLERLSAQGSTRIVLGLRDVLDDPKSVAVEWLCPGNVEAIERYYDSVWIYGDPQVYDAVLEYSLPNSIGSKVTYTGFIDQTSRVADQSSKLRGVLDSLLNDTPMVLCTVGGGQDGAGLAAEFIRAFPEDGRQGVLVNGPFMPDDVAATLRSAASRKKGLHVFDFVPEVDLLVERAERVVAMAGYNTVCSLLSFGKPSLLVPRVQPRCEQWIRAKSLADRGVVHTIHPSELSTDRLREWIVSDHPARPTAEHQINLAGLANIGRLALSLVSEATHHRGIARTDSSIATKET